MFINVSNHSSEKWSQAQKAAALYYGEIVDIPFPNIDPRATLQDISHLVKEYAQKILEFFEAPVVMVQGEYTFTHRLVNCLQSYNITVVSACSERKTVESVAEDGTVIKRSEFVFVQFRQY